MVERTLHDTYRQDHLALKNLEPNELIPMFDVYAYMNFFLIYLIHRVKERGNNNEIL